MNTSFPSYFATTRWSLVTNAGNSQSPRHKSALNDLCGRYWRPLYFCALNRGNAHADAEDLVQGFFYSQFLQPNFLRDVSRKKGRFRAFLRKCFRHYSLNERKRARCQKRGGGAEHLPLDSAIAAITAETPECMSDRAWRVALLERVLAQLGQEMHAEGKRELFEELKPSLALDGDKFSYREAAKRLNTTKGALRQARKRLLKRYRELIDQAKRKSGLF